MRYFIVDTHGRNEINNYIEDDFEYYIWDQSRYNLVEEGDLFIYRRPSKSSENGKFYFFGSGEFGEISPIESEDDKKMVRAKIINGEFFDVPLYQDDKKLQSYGWEFKDGLGYDKDDKGWMYFFNQYGITEITEEDYNFLINLINENLIIQKNI